MEVTVFKDPEVIELLNSRFIAAKFDVSIKENEKLKRKQGLASMPAYSIFTETNVRRGMLGTKQFDPIVPDVRLDYSQTKSILLKHLKEVAAKRANDFFSSNVSSGSGSNSDGDDEFLSLLLLSFLWGIACSCTPCCAPAAAATLSIFSSGAFEPTIAPDDKEPNQIGSVTPKEDDDRVDKKAKTVVLLAKAVLYSLGVSLSFALLGIAVSSISI
eukprot:g3368.t1